MEVKLYRKQKKAVATSIDTHFPNIFQTDWYFEEEKTDEELISEVKQISNASDHAWYFCKVIERFVDIGTVNLRKDGVNNDENTKR